VPLWNLVGRVDDEVEHDGAAFNRDLADGGYTIDVVAADGYSVSLDVERIREVNEIVVASLMDDEPLGEDDYPLRLVGPDLSGQEMVSQIAEILVNAEGGDPVEPTVDPGEVVVGDVTLEIMGGVAGPLTWSGEDLAAMGVAEVTAEHPRRGEVAAVGVRLNDLLDLVEPDAGATTVVFIASDGFTSRIPLDQIRACADCLVSFSDEGTLDMVMPGFTEGSAWAKDVVTIEIE
jgi:DMSO/TMAO reductase YedYZ molybdopterin-dependent catalytic subunit